jgi:hypothetical protein
MCDGIETADLVPAADSLGVAALKAARRRRVPALGSLRVPPAAMLVALLVRSALNSPDPCKGTQRLADARFVLAGTKPRKPALEVAFSMVPPRARKLYQKLKKSRLLWL